VGGTLAWLACQLPDALGVPQRTSPVGQTKPGFEELECAAVRGSGNTALLINHCRPFRPVRGPFSFGETECRIGEMNIAGVTIARASIGLGVRLKAIAVAIADGQRPTAESDSRTVRKGGVGGG
jgi:hypothetical protein